MTLVPLGVAGQPAVDPMKTIEASAKESCHPGEHIHNLHPARADRIEPSKPQGS